MDDYLLQARFGIGGEGSDQMTTVVLTGLLVANLSSNTAMAYLGLGFIAIQSLSYLVSGMAKALSPAWRKGGACAGVFNTRSYGNKALAGFLLSHPGLERSLCYATIVVEVLLGAAVVQSSPQVLAALLSVGVLFHLGVAAVMGLNTFLWSFLATYPAIVLSFNVIHRV
jgi:hypothetical protein